MKSYFEQAVTLRKKCVMQARTYMMLKRDAESIRGAGFGPRYGSGSKQAPFVGNVEKLEQEEAKLKALEARQKELHDQMEEVISQLENPNWQTVMRLSYVFGCTIPQCCEVMHVSDSSARKWRAEAMKMIVLPPDAIDIRRYYKHAEAAG